MIHDNAKDPARLKEIVRVFEEAEANGLGAVLKA